MTLQEFLAQMEAQYGRSGTTAGPMALDALEYNPLNF